MPKFLTTLRVEKQPDGQWKLIDPLQYETAAICPACAQKGAPPCGCWVVNVPAGFVTDFASIPQFAQNLISNDGPWDAPAVLHDFGYRTQPAGIPRSKWDALLMEAMKAECVTFWKRWAIYIGVRLGGWLAWKQNKKKFNL
jgi:hypothetical protein